MESSEERMSVNISVPLNVNRSGTWLVVVPVEDADGHLAAMSILTSHVEMTVETIRLLLVTALESTASEPEYLPFPFPPEWNANG